MIHNTAPIGVFDSGSGGLTVLKVLQKQLPLEQFVYLADTQNLPYGTKPPEQIIQYTAQAVTWLQNKAQVKLIVVACHTSSALALDTVQKQCTVPIVGTIYPLLHVILNNDRYKKIGIIATPASAQSKMHETIFKHHGFTGTIYSIGCPDFVPLIEAQMQDVRALTQAAHRYLTPFFTESLDTLLYGCTHYPLIESTIKPLLPASLHYIDPAYAIAHTVENILHTQALANVLPGTNKITYYCTKEPEIFSTKITKIIGDGAPKVTLTQL